MSLSTGFRNVNLTVLLTILNLGGFVLSAKFSCTKKPALGCTLTYDKSSPNDNKGSSVSVKLTGTRNLFIIMKVLNADLETRVIDAEVLGPSLLQQDPVVEAYPCIEPTDAKQKFSEVSSLAPDANTKVFLIVCGSVVPKTAAQLRACVDDSNYSINDIGPGQDQDPTFSYSLAWFSNCAGIKKDNNVYVEASSNANLPFNIVLCGPTGERPVVKIGTNLFLNDDKVVVKSAGDDFKPIIFLPKYFNGLTCEKFSKENQNTSEAGVNIDLGAEAATLKLTTKAQVEDADAWKVLAEFAAIAHKRALSLRSV